METRGGKILKVLIFSKMVARAWNFYTTLVLYFFSFMQNRPVVQSITATSTFQQLVHPIYATLLSKRFFPSRGSAYSRIRSFRGKDLDVRVSSSLLRRLFSSFCTLTVWIQSVAKGTVLRMLSSIRDFQGGTSRNCELAFCPFRPLFNLLISY